MVEHNRDIIDVIHKVVCENPNQWAIAYKDIRYTYEEVHQITNLISANLLNYVETGDVVGIYMEKTERYVLSILAILKCGCTYLPISKLYPLERIQTMLSNSHCRTLIVDNQDNLDFGVQTIEYSKLLIKEDKFCKQEILNKQEIIDKEEINKIEVIEQRDSSGIILSSIKRKKNPYAYIIYTSGSTGTPKGIRIRHESVINLASAMSERLGYQNGGSKIGMISPFVFDVSVGQMYMALMFGNELVLVPDEVKLSLKLLGNFIKDTRVDCLDFTPTRLELQVNYYEEHVESVAYPNKIISVGEQLPVTLAKRIIQKENEHLTIYNYYGPSEICVYCTVFEMNKHNVHTLQKMYIGQGIKNVDLYVLTEDMKPCKTNEVGELYIGGIGVSDGYINQPELNKTYFIDNPYKKNQIMYKSGDLVRLHEDGNLECLGRKDDQVKLRGYRIQLSEIEYAMETIEGVTRAKAIHIKESGVDFIAMYFTTSTTFQVQQVEEILSKKLPYYMIPTYYIPVDSFVYNLNGKLNKSKLPDYKSGIRSTRNQEVTFLIDETVGNRFLEICSRVLQRKGITLYDNFISLGGDSLTAFQLNMLLEEEWNITLEINEIVQRSNLAEIANIIVKRRNERNKDRKQVNLSNLSVNKVHENNLGEDCSSIPLYASTFQKVILKYEDKNINGVKSEKKDLPIYNLVYLVKSQQYLDQLRLSKALERVIQRHDMLRISFIKEGNKYRLNLTSQLEYPISLVYVNDVNELELAQYVLEFRSNHLPLFQFTIFEDFLGDQRLLMNLSHLISDHISMGLLARELFDAYNQMELPDITIGEYEYFSKKSLENHLENVSFWKDYLKDRPQGAIFDGLKAGPEANSKTIGNYQKVRFHFDEAERKQIKNFCKCHSVTEYIFFISLLGLLFYCEENEKQFMIGTYSMGRDQVAMGQRMIGLFTECLPFKFDMEDEEEFEVYLARQQRLFVQLATHKGIDVGNLYQYMSLKDLSKGALFGVTFNYMQAFHINYEKDDLILEDYSRNPAVLPLSMVGISTEDSIHFEITSEVRLYTEDYIHKIIKNYLDMIRFVMAKDKLTVYEIQEQHRKNGRKQNEFISTEK